MVRRTILAIALLALGVGLVYWWLPVPDLSLPAANGGYVDLHVHAAGIGAGGSGCFLSEQMRHGYKFRFYLGAFDVTLEELEREGDRVVLAKLSQKVAASSRVAKAVVLALDGVVGPDGELDRGRTQIYVPNDYLARELPAFKNLLFGASVNPYRPDALERLEQAKRDGAVLVKWIPGIMSIDPADEALVPFYDRLTSLGLPLLTHAGDERSFGKSDDELGDPARLRLALDRGVTVIVAHIASTGTNQGEDNFERVLPMFAQYSNLYADISALTQINRRAYLLRALERPDLHHRLVYGSDWPLQFFPIVSPWYHPEAVGPSRAKAIVAIDNQWDRDVALKEAMGVPPAVFRRSAAILGMTP